jgi:hypothetical protein
MTPPPTPDDTDDLETDPLADAQFDEASPEDISIDLELEDEPFLAAEDEVDEMAVEIPAEDELTFDIAVKEDAEPISLGDVEEPELSPEPAADTPADVPAEKPLEESVDTPAEEPSLDDPFPMESLGEDLNLDDIAFDEVSEEENFARVIPEGFEAEAEDSPLPDQDLVPEEPAERPADTPVENDGAAQIPTGFKQELKSVLSYMDQLLEALPEEKIEEFAKSQHFETYKKLFAELGIV